MKVFMHQKLNERVVDLNPQETSEWVESLDQVIDQAGPDRATYLLEKLTERARANGVELPVQLNTPYINTIRPEEEVPYQAIAPWSAVSKAHRWNAMPWWCGRIIRRRHWRPHLDVCVIATLLEVGSSFLPREVRRSARRPDLFPGPRLARRLQPAFLEAAQRRAPEELPP